MTSQTAVRRIRPREAIIWTAVAILGAVSWGTIALARGEQINAVWLLFAAIA